MITFLLMLIMAVLPQCEFEDGSTQAMCVWHGSNGVVVLNWDYGEQWITWER